MSKPEDKVTLAQCHEQVKNRLYRAEFPNEQAEDLDDEAREILLANLRAGSRLFG